MFDSVYNLAAPNGTVQQEIRGCCAHTFTDCCLHHNVLDPAVALDGQPIACSTTGESGPCVCIIDARRSNVIKVSGRCFPDVEPLMVKVLPMAVYIHARERIGQYFFIYSIFSEC